MIFSNHSSHKRCPFKLHTEANKINVLLRLKLTLKSLCENMPKNRLRSESLKLLSIIKRKRSH